MTIDELAAFVRDTGTRVARCGGTWWVESHPFFFRPLLPFSRLAPEEARYPLRSRFGGVQHVVPEGVAGNSTKRYFVFPDPQGYDLASLPHSRANKIRKGQRSFQWRRITDQATFVDEAHPVYAVFAQRTRYGFKSERKFRHEFAKWAGALFAHPKVAIRGAYRDDRLCAASVFCLVDDLLVNLVYFSDTESQRLQVHDFVLHQLRTEAAATDARIIYMGPYTGVEGVDRAKRIRGCTLISRPTYLRLNPVAAILLRLFRPQIHARLSGDAPPAAAEPAVKPAGNGAVRTRSRQPWQ